MNLLRTLFFFYLLILSVGLSAQTDLIEPLIDPDYKPDPSSDEGGFWYKIDKYEKKLKSSAYIVKDKELNNYISGLVCKLAGEYCSSIRVYIVNTPYFNASMYPNGMMHIWSGLLLRVANEDELVSVLAHEIAHYLRIHQITQWRKLRSGLVLTTFLDSTLTFGLVTLGYLGNNAAFSRAQEKEADIYGVQLMVKHGYSPQAAQSLWEYVIHERNQDTSTGKNKIFFATHPQVEDRANYLGELAKEYQRSVALSVSDDKQPLSGNTLVNNLTSHYVEFMNSQLDLREYERLIQLLKRHREIGYPEALVGYFEGEMYRLRKQEGDRQLAIESYKEALNQETSLIPDSIYRELGYLYLKEKRKPEALNYFEKYLEASPDANDKEMILFYADSLKGT